MIKILILALYIPVGLGVTFIASKFDFIEDGAHGAMLTLLWPLIVGVMCIIAPVTGLAKVVEIMINDNEVVKSSDDDLKGEL